MRLGLAGCVVLAFAVFMTGCGGGGNTTHVALPPAPAPQPSFTLSVSSPSVQLLAGGAAQTLDVTVAAANGFADTVSVSLAGVPSAVTVAPPTLSLKPGAKGTFSFSAASTATFIADSLKIQGVANTLKADAACDIVVSGADRSSPYRFVGGRLMHGFYDEFRKLLFASNIARNEIDVFSGLDSSLVARIPAPAPAGIDQLADGKTLVIGTWAQQVLTLDEDTYQLKQYPVTSNFGSPFGLLFPGVAALANGKVLLLGQWQGISSDHVEEAGQYVIFWNTQTNTFSLAVPFYPADTKRIERSADHKWAAFTSDQFYLYSSDSDSFTTASFSAVDPPNNVFGISNYALNSDGSRIAVLSADQVTFLDRSLAVTATAPIRSGFQQVGGATFSPDDRRLYINYGQANAFDSFDVTTLQRIGFYSSYAKNVPDISRFLAVSSAGTAFVGVQPGLMSIDLTSPVQEPANPNNWGPAYCPSPKVTYAPLGSALTAPLDQPLPGVNFYVGGKPAPLSADGSTIHIPAVSTAGFLDLQCVYPNGNWAMQLSEVSFGVKPLSFSANLLPPSGNSFAVFYGSGFTDANSKSPAVSINGQSVSGVVSPTTDLLTGIQRIGATIPAGSPLSGATLTVSNGNGTGTLQGEASYIASAKVLPQTGLLQLTYDPLRNIVYALKANEIDVLDPANLSFKTPIALTAVDQPFNVMALSPDGSRIIVGSQSGRFVILDPDHPSAFIEATVNAPSASASSIAILKNNKAIVTGTTNHLVDLSSGAVSVITNPIGNMVRASADGSVLFGTDLEKSSGTVYAIDTTNFTTSVAGFGFLYWADLAVSPDGSRFATLGGAPGAAIGVFDPLLHLLNINATVNTSVYPVTSPPTATATPGAQYSPGGSVIVLATGNSIEFWDAAQLVLRARLLTPEPLLTHEDTSNYATPMVALDSTGETVFALSKSGVTMLRLGGTIDTLAQHNWPF